VTADICNGFAIEADRLADVRNGELGRRTFSQYVVSHHLGGGVDKVTMRRPQVAGPA